MSKPSIPENPHILTAIAMYRRQGMHERDIQLTLRISRATYFRCVAALERRRLTVARGGTGGDGD